MNEKIKYYFDKGIEKGYSREYIRQVLLERGWNREDVDYAYNTLLNSEMEQRYETSKEDAKSPLMKVFVILLTALFIGAGGFFIYNAAGPESITGATAGTAGISKDDVNQRFSEITKLNDEISAKKAELEQQLADARQKDLTIEEKNAVIENQFKELENIHTQMDVEREKIKDLLWDLLNTLIERSNKFSKDK